MNDANAIPIAGSHQISLPAAVEMTTTYRANREAILAAEYRDQDILPLSETFNRQDIDSLMALQNCAGIRIYYGMTNNLQTHAIIVAVDENNIDILPATTLAESEDDETGYIVEEGQRCPPICKNGSPLNP